MTPEERKRTIETRLEENFAPAYLEVLDDSYQHVGHAGARSGAGYYTIKIQSESFVGKSKIAAHQMVYKVLGDMMEKEIHALQIHITA